VELKQIFLKMLKIVVYAVSRSIAILRCVIQEVVQTKGIVIMNYYTFADWKLQRIK
jgi:hypothetical protein